MASVEFLTCGRFNHKVEPFMRRLRNAAQQAGHRVAWSGAYQGRSDWLVLYGPGGAAQREAMSRHHGRVVCFDLGYWTRVLDPLRRKWRVSFDGPHPQRFVWQQERPGDRLQADRIDLKQTGDRNGYVLLCSSGQKSRNAYGDGISWELDALRRIREAMPGVPVVYRPKRAEDPRPEGLPVLVGCPIEQALKGARLVVARHSNVTVDAAIWGVPAVCADGAGAALWGSELTDIRHPSPRERRRFLEQLAWFQWNAQEAEQCWQFIRGTLRAPCPSRTPSSTDSLAATS